MIFNSKETQRVIKIVKSTSKMPKKYRFVPFQMFCVLLLYDARRTLVHMSTIYHKGDISLALPSTLYSHRNEIVFPPTK